jgi:hypothetical protein
LRRIKEREQNQDCQEKDGAFLFRQVNKNMQEWHYLDDGTTTEYRIL